MIHRHELMLPMPDGVALYTHIYEPEALSESLPVLLMRLPYGCEIASTVTYAHPSWYAAQGFIVVIQAVRGCDCSGGRFYPFQVAESSDAAVTIAWCRQLPHSNGRVGMYGFSYQGVTQFMAAGTPGLQTICPSMATLQFGEGWNLWGGALALDFVVPWAVQLAQDQAQFRQQEPQATVLGRSRAQLITDWLDYTPLKDLPLFADCDFGQDWLLPPEQAHYMQQQIPAQDLAALHIAGWADPFIEATLAAYESYCHTSTQPQHLIIGPWQHLPWSQRVGDLDFGETARSKYIDQYQVRWFKHWLTDEPQDLGAPVQLFEMGANCWLEADQWPLPTQTQTLYLQSNGFAQGPDSEGELVETAPSTDAWDSYVYDPRIATPATAYGPVDQRPVQRRRDLLIYTSAPLSKTHTLCGAAVQLQVSTTAPACDWVVRLSKVEVSGRILLLTAGVRRCTHTPHIPTQVTIRLRPTCWTLYPGERLQLCLSSAAFPWLDRNPNTGQWPAAAQWSEFATTTQTLWQGSSHLKLQLLGETTGSVKSKEIPEWH